MKTVTVISSLVIIINLLTSRVSANEVYKIVKISCDQTTGVYELSAFKAFNVYDTRPDADSQWREVVEKTHVRQGNDRYYLAGSIEDTCRLSDALILTRIGYAEPRASGVCGADPMAILTIEQDGKEIVGTQFDACGSFISVHQVTYSRAQRWNICFGAWEQREGMICTQETPLDINRMFAIFEQQAR